MTKYPQYALVKVTGNVDNVYQKDSNCIITVGDFWIDSRNECLVYTGQKVSLIGRVTGGVIDRLLGRLWLDSAEIIVLSETSDTSLRKGILVEAFSVIRNYCTSTYRRYLPEPESGLTAGIVLGNKNDIGQEMYKNMIKSGTVHIAVASGYNIMLVGGTVISICFWYWRRKTASIVAILAMIFYALEAGGEPPAIRAVIMAGVVFVAAAVGRKVVSWWVLLVTGWLMIVVEPLMILSVSFQLSMAASIGLLMMEPKLSRFLSKKHEKLAELLGGVGLLTSISTMLLTAPIIWWHFGQMSWNALLSNTLILPLIPILMITGAGMQVLPGLFSWVTYVAAHWMVGVIRFFGS